MAAAFINAFQAATRAHIDYASTPRWRRRLRARRQQKRDELAAEADRQKRALGATEPFRPLVEILEEKHPTT